MSRIKTDWKGLDPADADEQHKAALADPDNRPLSSDDLSRMKRTPQVAVLRRALQLTQEQFAERFQIPIGTLRDWEQGRSVPDQPARAYLRVIAREPERVRVALDADR